MLKPIAALFLTALSVNAISQTTAPYHILKKNKIGGTGGWDYLTVNPENNRIYVSHGTQVAILDATTGDSIAGIPNTPGVHGIAVVNPLGKGYTSNGRSNTSTIFDIKTNKVLGEIKTGQNPDAIFYDDFSKKIYTCNGRSNDATVIDPATDQVVATIPLGGKPETAVSDGKGNIFINIEDKSEVVQIDAKSFAVKQRWKLEGGEEPTGLAMDRASNRLFAGCGNKIMVVLDATTGKTIAQVPIGDGCDGVAFDQERKLAFCSNGEGTVTVIKEVNANKFEVLETVKTEVRARTIAVNQKNHHVYLPTAEYPATATGGGRPQAVAGSFHVLELGN